MVSMQLRFMLLVLLLLLLCAVYQLQPCSAWTFTPSCSFAAFQRASLLSPSSSFTIISSSAAFGSKSSSAIRASWNSGSDLQLTANATATTATTTTSSTTTSLDEDEQRSVLSLATAVADTNETGDAAADTTESFVVDDGDTSTSTNSSNCEWQQQEHQHIPQLTSALLRISYDGRHFTGWSGTTTTTSSSSSSTAGNNDTDATTFGYDGGSGNRRSRRRRRNQMTGGSTATAARSGFVRSAQGVLQSNLAKIYGKAIVGVDIVVDDNDDDIDHPAASSSDGLVVVEGCSRLDKGVHAVGMVAQIYCLTSSFAAAAAAGAAAPNITNINGQQPSIPGKRLPHPWNATDNSCCFAPLPKQRLPELAFALNRMMCPDIQIMAIAPVPTKLTSVVTVTTANSAISASAGSPLLEPERMQRRLRPFHPTLDARAKTYRYTFSVGSRHDPTQWRTVWHVVSGDGGGRVRGDDDDDGKNKTALQLLKQACSCLQGRHDYAAFQGAPRGPDDKRKRIHQDTFCSIDSISLRTTVPESSSSVAACWNDATTTYVMEITGDRFLYKMVRFLVGAVVAVGIKRKLTLADLERFLETGDRIGTEFECAPAHGLVLHQVHYDTPIDWQPPARPSS